MIEAGVWAAPGGQDPRAGSLAAADRELPPYGLGAVDPWRPPGRPVDPARRRRTWRQLTGRLMVVLLLVAGAAVVQDRREGDARAAVLQALPGLEAFVAAERGLAFTGPVQVDLLDDQAFLDAFHGDDSRPPDAGGRGATLRGLGQIRADEDFGELTSNALSKGVAGFYHPGTKHLYVRGSRFDARARLVLVHELTHALQDQAFDLGAFRPASDDDDAVAARSALVEGDAVRIEKAYYDAQPAKVRAEVDRAGGVETYGPTGDVVVDRLDFPYYAGPVYVGALLAQGGQAALDTAFTEPPVPSTAQVLHLGHAEPVKVPEPDPAGREVLDSGVLGELGLAQLLGEDPLGDGPQTAWAGDSYVTTREQSGPCTYDAVVLSDSGARDALAAALREAGITVVRQGSMQLTLTACGG